MRNREIILKTYNEIKNQEEYRDYHALKGMLQRTKTIVRTSSYEMTPPTATTKAWDKIKIATISTKSYLLTNSIETCCLAEQDKTCNDISYKLYGHSSSTFKKVLRSYKRNLLIALEHKPDFICFNELAFPNHIDGRFKREIKKLEREIQTKAEEIGSYIIAGTYHDLNNFHNVCKIYFPIHSNAPVNESPILHAKKTSALSVDEKVMIPYNRFIRYYHTDKLSFGVLICLDSYDSSIISSILKRNKNRTDATLDIIFVPSYTNSSPIAKKACQEISYLCGNIVVYVNTHDFTPYNAVYIGGKPLTGRFKEAINDNITMYTLSQESYLKSSQIALMEHGNTFNFIFGDDPLVFQM
jgi:predicted amidohydrolase